MSVNKGLFAGARSCNLSSPSLREAIHCGNCLADVTVVQVSGGFICGLLF